MEHRNSQNPERNSKSQSVLKRGFKKVTNCVGKISKFSFMNSE